VDTSTANVLAKIPVSELPDIIDITPDGKAVWLTSRKANAVDVIDTTANKKIATIPAGNDPHGIVISK